MASATTAPLPIYYNTDVHNFYIKQKQEFHFTQKSDNEFLMFLLDTAVRVISIVQHLAPVIEAVSDAGVEVDDVEDEISPIHTPNTTANVSSGAMDVDTIAPAQPSALSAELEQINQEITNAQISSQQLPRQPAIPTRRPAPVSVPAPAPAPVHVPASAPVAAAPTSVEAEPAMMTVSQPTVMLPVSQPPAMMSAAQPTSQAPSTSVPRHDAAPQPLPPNVPVVQLPSSAHSSENISTSLPSATQPIAEPPDESHSVKTEQPVPEVIEIKEEMNDPAVSASSELLSQDTLDQLMSSISGAEDNAGLQNFVPTATPSSLPPSFLDRGAGNPLSMLGSLNSGDGPGPSGLNVPNISESMMKNINDAGLNVSSIKGQANPSAGLANCYVYKVEPVELEVPTGTVRPVINSERRTPALSSPQPSKTTSRRPPSQLGKRKTRTKTARSNPIRCAFCDTRFISHEDLRKHLHDESNPNASHTPLLKQLCHYSCHLCPMSFLTKACRAAHLRTVHKMSPHDAHSIQEERPTPTRAYVQHYLRGKLEKSVCIFCKKIFDNRELLIEHEKTHLVGLNTSNQN